MSLRAHNSKILLMMRSSSARPADTVDMPPTSSTGFLARTAHNHTGHAPLQIVTVIVQMSFRVVALYKSLLSSAAFVVGHLDVSCIFTMSIMAYPSQRRQL